jgi:RHS repeat-associated protein
LTEERWEAYTGLLFLRARYYEPQTGRFLIADPWPGELLKPRSLFASYQYAGNNPVNLVDLTGLDEWRRSTSYEEEIIGRFYEQGQPHIHLEAWPLPIGRWRPDILNSRTGDVFEIKPFDGGRGAVLAWTEAIIYAEALNSFKAGSFLGGPTGLLPSNRPNDWNTIDWHPGSPLTFGAYRRFPGGSSIVTARKIYYVPKALDFVVASTLPGSVAWWYELRPETILELVPCYFLKKIWDGSKKLEDLLRQPLPEGSCCPAPVWPIFIVCDPNDPQCPSSPCWYTPGLCKREQN